MYDREGWKCDSQDEVESFDFGVDSTKQTYGFPSTKAPPQVEHLTSLEDDLYDLLHRIQFTTHLNEFQKQLHWDVKEITNSTYVFVSAEKNPNIDHVTGDECRKLLIDNITNSYKTIRSLPHRISTTRQALLLLDLAMPGV